MSCCRTAGKPQNQPPSPDLPLVPGDAPAVGSYGSAGRVRCPRMFGRLLLLLRRWLCSTRRRKPEHPCDTPCRTARRIESWAIPSLLRATPSATSEHLLGLLGSSPIPPSSSLLAFAFNWGHFPPPALPGFVGTT